MPLAPLTMLLLLTGLTGLVYEVVAGRLLALHLGSSGASQAITLATFLGGMSLGALAVAPLRRGPLQRWRQPLMGYAVLEAFIGLWALILAPLAERLYPWLEAALLSRDPGSFAVVVAKLLLAAVLCLPLAMAMGATLPVLAVAVQRQEPDSSHIWVSRMYAVNAGGAALGAWLGGFVLIDRFGLELPLVLGAMINLAVAAIVLRMAKQAPDLPHHDATDDAPVAATAGLWPLALLAAATGLVALFSEVLWTRLHALLLGSSVYAFAAMLCMVIGGISLGSGLALRSQRRGAAPETVFAVSQIAAALAALFVFVRLDGLPMDLLHVRARLAATAENYPLWLVLAEGWIALHLLPAAAALGAAFPALLAMARDRGLAADRATGGLLAANTAGNLAGALAGGFVWMPWLGLDGGLLACAVLSLLVAALAWRPWTATRATLLGFAAAGLAVAAMAAPTMGPLDWGLYRDPPQSVDDIARLVRGHARGRPLLRHDGKDATLTVQQFSKNVQVFRVNGKIDGSTGADAITQIVIGHIGHLFRPAARDLFLVGLGTGQTAGAMAVHPGTRLLVAELSPAMEQVAALFARWNGDVLRKPNVRVHYTDGREVMRTLPAASLDLVVSQPSNPWVVGVADLYTVEHFERLARVLRPDGLLVQWMQSYEISDAVVARVICTLQGVFPHIALFRTQPGDLVLVASGQPLVLDPAAAAATLAQPVVRAEIDSHHLARMPLTLDDWLAMQLAGPQTVQKLCRKAGPRSAARFTPLRERFPRLEYDAPVDLFARRDAKGLVGALDTRTSPQADTEAARWLAKVPLDGPRRASLHAFVQRWGTDDERPLQLALRGPVVDPAADPSATAEAVWLSQVPDANRVSGAGSGSAATRLDGSPEAERWCQWLDRTWAWLLPALRTQYGPALGREGLAQWRERCLKGPARDNRGPQSAPLP